MFVYPRPSLFRTPVDYALLGFFILSGISGIFSYSPVVSIGKMRAASLFTIVYLLAQNVQSLRLVRLLALTLIGSCMANVLLTAGQLTLGKGVKVQGVAQASPLTKAVFRTRTVHQPTPIVNGDTIWEVDGEPVGDPEELAAALASGNPTAKVRIYRVEWMPELEIPRGQLLPGTSALQQLGISAEGAMSRATGGINTHRGAIFSLGLLVAGAASLRAQHLSTAAEAVCGEVASRWGATILAAPVDCMSHGQRVAQRHGAQGARGEAARGFPSLREIAIPALRQALHATPDRNAAMVQTLMTLVATTEDTNILHRGGAPGLALARRRSREFLDEGGIHAGGWQARLASIGRVFESLRLSPGGSADLLACAWFLVRLDHTAK